MRQYMKKELLEMVKLLEKANETIQKSNQSNTLQLGEMLAECQRSAIEIGNTIEQIEGEGSITVSLLEEYCENVYQISEMLRKTKTARRLFKENRNLLIKISHSIRYDLSNSKKEIIFLPYKASMWDSMESIWMAARDDESCDVYVIPIPYFDKNKEGTLGQMHYEGNEYPKYVPVTSWEKYSISEHQPDVIYIHNPYDENNYVISVHPVFYAKKLKKHTNMLVYIPYFVCSDDVPEHFCVLPGTLHANKVIVQSEKVRQTYIKEFHEMEEEYNCKDGFGIVEEKFLGLGSPKFDKVINTRRDNIDVPEEWEKLIIKPDGTRKKIIFYNTSIQATLNHQEKIIRKIRNVLQIFQENSDVVVLWRPHPLMKETFLSMCPELLKGYNEIVDTYRKENYGIYDSSVDVHRAIALSDAYYGDMSSVVELYRLTGKPIMIQHVEILEE